MALLGKRLRTALILLAVTAAIVGLLYYSLRGVELTALRSQLVNADYRYAILAVGAVMAVFVVKAIRWQLLLRPIKPIRLYPLFSAIMIGFMANCIISRVGEVIRAAILGMKKETRTSTALATIAVERIFDMASLVFYLLVGLAALGPARGSSEEFGTLRAAEYSLGAALALGVGFLVALWRWPKRTERGILAASRVWLKALALLGAKPKWTEWLDGKVTGFVESFLPGLRTLQSLPQVLGLVALSLLHWGLQIVMFWAASYCLGSTSDWFPLTFPQSCLVFAFTALGVAALPLPGFVGIFQGGVTTAMLLIGAPRKAPDVAAFSMIAWLVNIPPIIIVGFVFLWMEGIGLRELRTTGQAADDRPAGEAASGASAPPGAPPQD